MCNYIRLSQVYCVRQVVKTPAIILNNPVFLSVYIPPSPPSMAIIWTRSTGWETQESLFKAGAKETASHQLSVDDLRNWFLL